MLNIQLPSSSTFFNLLNNNFKSEEAEISNMLSKRDTPIHFIVDGWTDRSNTHFLGILFFNI